MKEEVENLIKPLLKEDLPEIRPGDTVAVHQKIKEKDKERIQVFEGQVLAIKHGKGINGTITVRKISSGIGIERVFPIHAPFIQKIEVKNKVKAKRAKLNYLRTAKGRKLRLKKREEKKSPGAGIR